MNAAFINSIVKFTQKPLLAKKVLVTSDMLRILNHPSHINYSTKVSIV